MGRSLTFGDTSDDETPRLVLVQNFFEELRQRAPR